MATTTTTTNPSLRPVASADHARRMAASRADTTTPLETIGAVVSATIPEPPTTRPAATFTVHALIDDFPFDVQFTGTADQLAATVQRLRAIGAVPPTQAARAAVEAERERTAPVCQYHGVMKESSKAPGTFYCPAKMGNGDYCKSKG